MRRGFTLLLPLLLSLAGCPHRTSSQDGPAELTPFTSASELKAYLADQYRATHRGGLFGGAMGGVPTSAEADNASGSGGYSSTNIQEEGVDESDVLKTDGTYLYVLANQKLDIIQAVPADAMSVVGRLDLDLPGSELYLSGSRAIVLARPSNYYWYDAMPMAGPGAAAQATVSAGSSVAPSAPGGGGGTADGATEAPWRSDMMTFDVYIVDVGKPDAPALVRKYSFQGDLLTSRMVGGKLYLVSYTWPSVADPEGVSEADVADILPKYRTVVAGQESVQPLVGWAGVYHPANPDGYSIINVTTLDTGNLDAAPASTGAMAGYGVVYASTKALYVSSPNWDPYGAARDQTDIHKFSLTGQTAQYVGSGRVPGWLLNQFSLGEQDDLLRVATTEGHAIVGMPMPGLVGAAFNGRMPASENHVVVLEQVGNKLEIAGRIDGIAPGEQLYAARFVGNRGFLVTFQKIDPLFTVDLSDPRNPVLAGELEVPGYSEYIHMIDENHLLTIGKAVLDMTIDPVPFHLLANARIWCGLAVIAASYLTVALLRDEKGELAEEVRPALLLLANLYTLVFVSMDLWQYFGQPDVTFGGRSAQQLSLSIFWSCYALIVLCVGIWRRARLVRLFAMGLLYLSIFKVFLLDLSFLETPYRIASFFGLGVILLVVSLLYTRFEAQVHEGTGVPGVSAS